MSYQISAHKYRPQTFGEVVGQEAVVTTLKNAILSGRLAPAYLFCGSQGTGKTTLARLLAKTINCSKLTTSCEPCNQCPFCLDVKAGKSLDIMEIDGASNRGIDDIRKINETIGYAPTSGKYKIYIIDEVHMLTKEAFNALLKTLEEPPANVKFFFATTELHKVLSTIVSRCQRFDLRRIPLALIKNKLRQIAQEAEIDISEPALELLAERSEGSLRDAESLFDQVACFAPKNPQGTFQKTFQTISVTEETVFSALGLIPQHLFFKLDKAIFSSNLAFAFEMAEELFASGKEFSSFLEGLISHYRTLLFYKLPTAQSAKNPLYAEAAALYTEEQCLYIMDFLMRTLHQMLKTPFKRAALEMILLHLVRSHKRIPIEALVQRLTQLQSLHTSSTVPLSVSPTVSSTVPLTVSSKTESLPQPHPKVEVTPAPAEAIEEIPAPKIQGQQEQRAEQPPSQPLSGPVSRKEQSKYDTVIRFAAIELEGTVYREQQ